MSESFCLTIAATAGNNIGKVLLKKGTLILPPLSFKIKAFRGFPDGIPRLTRSVTVGNKKISVKKSGGRKQAAGGDGNIIIDSGTTLTFLPSDIYSAFEPTLEKAITGGQRVDGPPGLDLCYKSGGQVNVPTITVNFAGATVEVLPESVFLEVEDGVICSTFQGADAGGGTAIFGNQHQVNYLVGYDLNAGQVSFKKTQCGN